LLHKIDPTALRSSFADICMACANISARRSPAEVSDRRKCLEIARRVTASQPRLALGSISSSRCQTSRAPRPKPRTHGFKILTNEFECWLHQIGGAVWWSQTGSNRRPPACKAGALPTELWPRTSGICWLAIAGSPSRSSRQPARPAFARRATARQLSLAARAKAGGPGKI
jgi:hypothetical protein